LIQAFDRGGKGSRPRLHVPRRGRTAAALGCLALVLWVASLTACDGSKKTSGLAAVPVRADPLDDVNPFVGTGGWGFGAGSLVPGPQWPNGMIRPCADTSLGAFAVGFQHFAGYWYEDTDIRGFSHTRLVGTGANDQGNIRLMPVLGISDRTVSDEGTRSGFSHEGESAAPGRYWVVLDSSGIEVELAALKWTALHRYTYPCPNPAGPSPADTPNPGCVLPNLGSSFADPGSGVVSPAAGSQPYVVVNASASIIPGDVREAEVLVDPLNREISGSLLQQGGLSGRYGGLPTFFAARFSQPFHDFGTFKNGRIKSQSVREQGKDLGAGADLGAYAGFDLGDMGGQLTVKVAISFLSVDQARKNLQHESPGFDFPGAVEANRRAWREKLDRVEVSGGTESERRIFTTALYHAYMMPTLFTEAGGVYMGFDGAEHQAEGFTYYTDMSLWDTFRTLHPLMALIDPDRARDFVVSLIRMLEQGGDLPRWPMGRGYTGCMIGTHADSVIAEAYLKGVGDFDVETAYQGMVRHATQSVPHAGRSDLDHYLAHGYCATDHTGQAPSKTLEYAYDDFCVGVLARELGRIEEAEVFFARSGNYANLWDPQTRFFRGKDSGGDWFQPFLPLWPFAEEYVEGNAWHWLWFVPHDVPGIIRLFGGTGPFLEKLAVFFQRASEMGDTLLPDIYYWHGNEPDIHAAYLFNEAGRPDLTAKWARWIMRTKYRDSPDGIDGNDDGGTLSSWYVFSAMGFFPLNPCDGRYMIGSPLFDEIVLHLSNGDFVVRAENNSERNLYVQSADLNGRPLEESWFRHEEIIPGGTLLLRMGPEPSAWGKAR